jgi:integrase
MRKTGNKKLTPVQIKAFISRHKQGKEAKNAKLSDGDGMYLQITGGGRPTWRIKYRLAGVEKTYTVGPYGEEEPAFTLTAARMEREKVRAWLREGKDPVQAREVARAATTAASGNTFEVVARDWLAKQEKDWSAIHYKKSMQALEREIFPQIGALPVDQIRPAMITRCIENMVRAGTVDTAFKVRQNVARVFKLAAARDLCNYAENPADPAREVLPRKSQQKNRPAFTKWTELGEVLRGAEKARLSPAVRLAHRLIAFGGGVRISNVVQAEWREFDLDGDVAMWVIPRAKMKAQDRAHDHKVILGPTIASELRAWRELNGSKGYVFPSPANPKKHISRESIEKAYRVTLKLADKHSPHGWRSALSTLARDEGGFERDVVELALDHIHDNDVVRAYDRGERLEQRIRLMRWWDKCLTEAQAGGRVIPLARTA